MFPKRTCGREIEDVNSATALVPGAVSAGTLVVAFTLLAVGFEYFWVTFIVGFGVVLPTATGLAAAKREEGSQAGTNRREKREDDDALATLRQRYAQGEISDAEFEHQVERLLETETPPETHSATGE
jgi:uncharacterized membrane protein